MDNANQFMERYADAMIAAGVDPEDFDAAQKFRLSNGFYKVKDETGQAVPFKMRFSQAKFLNDLHGFDICLKARQLGFTTLIQIKFLDDALFFPGGNISVGIIAHNLSDAESFFNDKIKFAYDNLPDEVRAFVPSRTDSAKTMSFANGSQIRVGTSLRSGTFQRLHVSEFGKVCAKYPEKAREINTGALNTVHVGQQVIIESTAEGQGGIFFKMCEDAMARQALGERLSEIDFKFHFFPWWQDVKYVLDPEYVTITKEMRSYFARLENREGITLTDEQKAWYVRKRATQMDDMKREFPATPKEAFEAAIEGAYFASEIDKTRTRGNVRLVPYRDDLPVNTFWDLGIGDKMCIWFSQTHDGRPVMIDYYENHSEGAVHYAGVLRDKPYMYGAHYIPHDGKQRTFETAETKEAVIERLTRVPVRVVPRTTDVTVDIQVMRNVIPITEFDMENCTIGLRHLTNYRREWDEKRAVFRAKPLHNDASNGADAYRTFAICWVRGLIDVIEYDPYDEDYNDFNRSDGRSETTGY